MDTNVVFNIYIMFKDSTKSKTLN